MPRASRSEIVGEHDGALKVRLAAPPVDNAANEELIILLAKEFGVAKSAVKVMSGHTSKNKQIFMAGVVLSNFRAILQAKN